MSLPAENELRRRNISPATEPDTTASDENVNALRQPVSSVGTSTVSNSATGGDSSQGISPNSGNQRLVINFRLTPGSTSRVGSITLPHRHSIPSNNNVSTESARTTNQAEQNAQNRAENNANQAAANANTNVIRINLQLMPPRLALGTNYARISSRMSRSLLELSLLLHAVLALVFLIYVQQRFLASPIDCIEQQPSFRRYVEELETRGLPLRDYVVRVHAQYGASRLNLDVAKSVALERLLMFEFESEFDALVRSFATAPPSSQQTPVYASAVESESKIEIESSNKQEEMAQTQEQSSADNYDESAVHDGLEDPSLQPLAIFEYSNVVGYLQLSHEARSRLNVTVLFFVLDLASTGERCCVRTRFERVLFDAFGLLNYDELVLTALKTFVMSSAHLQLTAELPYRSQGKQPAANATEIDQSDNSNRSDTVGDLNDNANMTSIESSASSQVLDETGEDTHNQHADGEEDTEQSNTVKLGRGYIKNLLRNELYQLVPGLTLSRFALLVPFTVMLVFTGAVCMLLQYARSQLYMLYFHFLQLAFELLRSSLIAGGGRVVLRHPTVARNQNQTQNQAQMQVQNPSQSQSDTPPQPASQAASPAVLAAHSHPPSQDSVATGSSVNRDAPSSSTPASASSPGPVNATVTGQVGPNVSDLHVRQAAGTPTVNVNVAANPNAVNANAAQAPRRDRRRLLMMMFNTQLPPAVNVILACIGVQAMMVEFFDTELTALCVMMLVWMSDEYHLLLRSARGRSEWLKCFYLCHFLVYAFHYRFSGHYTELALYASFSWMLFFMTRVYHSYELPLFAMRRHPTNANGAAAQ